MRKTTVGIIGSSGGAAGTLPAETIALAEKVGTAVARAGAVLVSGGTGGVMEAASRGAHQGGGLTIGFLPQADHSHANEFVDIAFPTGMGTMRNVLTPRGCDVIIMIGGGVGTLNELTIAYDAGTPAIIVTGSGGWADRIVPSLVDGAFLDERRVVALSLVADPDEAVRVALRRSREPHRTGGLTAFIGGAGQ